jgi:hypothetical protein
VTAGGGCTIHSLARGYERGCGDDRAGGAVRGGRRSLPYFLGSDS